MSTEKQTNKIKNLVQLKRLRTRYVNWLFLGLILFFVMFTYIAGNWLEKDVGNITRQETIYCLESITSHDSYEDCLATIIKSRPDFHFFIVSSDNKYVEYNTDKVLVDKYYSDVLLHNLNTLKASKNNVFVSDRMVINNLNYYTFAIRHDETYIVGYVPYMGVINGLGDIHKLYSIIMIILGFAILLTGSLIIAYNLKQEQVEEKEAEKEKSQFSEQMKSSFVANISHEIRTPLNSILGMNEMILRESNEDNIRSYANDVALAGEWLLSIVNDVLDISKIESGNMEIVEADYNIESIFHVLDIMMRNKALAKGISFEASLDEMLPKRLYGDKIRIQQIIANLLSNAVKYTDTGRVVFSISFERIENADNMINLKITVKDTGRGIKLNDQNSIFDSFVRSDLYETASIEGTGLGLAITKNLVERMHGQITLQSEYGKGSIFYVTIPQKISAVQESLIKATEDEKGPEFIDTRILVVDDVSMNLTVIQNLLKRTGITVDTALSGKEALEKMSDITYDLVLLDDRMPVMDGRDTYTEIKNKDLNRCPIIMFTANVGESIRQECIDLGFTDYLTKPVKGSDLEIMLKKYINSEKLSTEESHDNSENNEIKGLPGWLCSLKEIDVQTGLTYCGDAEIYISVLTTFLEDAVRTAENIRIDLKNNNIKDFTTRIHALKSSSRTIGALRLSALAKKMEDAGNDEDMNYIKENIDILMSLYGEIVTSISAIKISEDEDYEEIIDDPGVIGIYKHLKGYVDDFNEVAIGSMLKALKPYRFPGKEQKRYDELCKAYECVDWEKMQELLEDI